MNGKNFYRIKVRYVERKRFSFQCLITEFEALKADQDITLELGNTILLEGIKRDIPTFREFYVWGEVYVSRDKLKINVINFQIIEHLTEPDLFMFLTEEEMGIDPITARKLFDLYGEDALTVFTTRRQEQEHFPTITKFLANRVVHGIFNHLSKYEFNRYLGDYGFTRDKLMALNSKFTNELDQLLTNPFILCEHNVPFQICDEIAIREEIEEYYSKKTFALIYQSLKNYLQEGTHMAYADLFGIVAKALDREADEHTQYLLDKEIKRGMNKGKFWLSKINNEYRIGLGSVFKIESNIASEVSERIQTKSIEGLDQLIQEVESENLFAYAEKQKDAIKVVMNNRFSIITGGPGVGKTTVVDGVLRVFDRLYPNSSISLCAPSGKASKRLQESTGRMASTIHSLLGLTMDENQKPNQLTCDLLVVDETSMIDMYVAEKLLTNINKDAKIVFVGDVDQLESVDAGNVLYDLIHSEVVPVVKLDLVQRQSGHSSIAVNAKKINRKESDLVFADDFVFIETSDEAEAQSVILDLYRKHKEEDVVILSPVRNKHKTSTSFLNPLIQEVYTAGEQEIKVRHKTFRVNDKVMQIVNNNTGNNGDTGVITNIEGREARILFDDGRQVIYDSYELLDYMELSYAQTIHKSQGSEYPVVIMPVLSSHSNLNRNLIYTGITRAKKKVIMVGEERIMRGIIDESLKKKKIRETLVKELLKSKAQ